MPSGRTLCCLITLLNAGYPIGSPPQIARNIFIQTNMIDYYTSARDAGNLPLQQGFHLRIRDLTIEADNIILNQHRKIFCTLEFTRYFQAFDVSIDSIQKLIFSDKEVHDIEYTRHLTQGSFNFLLL